MMEITIKENLNPILKTDSKAHTLVINQSNKALLTISQDGVVEGKLEDMGEAAKIFVESIRHQLNTLPQQEISKLKQEKEFLFKSVERANRTGMYWIDINEKLVNENKGLREENKRLVEENSKLKK